jgi:hypothetical protein
MKKLSNYYLYIIPQTGKVYRLKDFSHTIETILCRRYGRIFAISGYSKAAKIISLSRDDRTGELTSVSSLHELKLDKDFEMSVGYLDEVFPEESELTEEDIAEGIRCSLL